MDLCSIQVANGSQPPRVAAAGSRRRRKCRSMREIMKVAKRVDLTAENDVGGGDYYSEVRCEECGSGEIEDEMLLCNKCDRGHHMRCLRPIVTRIPFGSWICPACSTDNNNNKSLIESFTEKEIFDFFRIQSGDEFAEKCDDAPKDTKKRRRRTSTLEFRKKRRRLLTHIPSQDPARRLAQMRSLAMAMTSQNLEYSNELTYNPSMAPRSANRSSFENGGMQILCKEDVETLKNCRALYRRGEFPPLVVAFDSLEGYTVQADGPIKDMTLIAEYAGDVDYIRNREEDDCDSMMTLLSSADPSKSLVACADRLGNISRFISGINNHITNGRKKLNIKCVRYNVDGECVVLLVANRDIAKEADGLIKDMTLIAEYAGDVDYIRNRQEDDCDNMMTLLSSADPSKSLVACADRLGNISRFISGINNHTTKGRKKQNIKCVRYNVDKECVVLLVANRDIAKGERLCYDYNGCEYEYPTHYFV